MEHNIKIKELNNENSHEIECEMKEMDNKVRLFLNVETKKLWIKSVNSSRQEIAEKQHFQEQLQRLAKH